MSAWHLHGPSWLFVPADRPERIRRAMAAADHAVIDLEDAVAPEARSAAREGLAAAVVGLEQARAIVRINRLDGPDAAADLAAVRAAGITTVMVPKAEDADRLAASGPLEGLTVVALCESARGIAQAAALAEVSGVVALMWGSIDLAADLGCRAEDPILFRARDQILYAARAAGCVAVDRVCPSLEDDLVAMDSGIAANAGYDAKAILHPRHVPTIAKAFTPEPEELAWAAKILDRAVGSGAQLVDGEFIDEAVLARARRLLGQG